MSTKEFLNSLPHPTLAAMKEISLVKPMRGAYLYATVFAAIAAIFFLEAYFDNPFVTLLAIVLIAGRQHSLYILNHDAAHRGLFRMNAANKWVATVLSNFVMFHHPSAWSFEQWKRIHDFHHSEVFTAGDPNYLDRQVNGDTGRILTIPLLFWGSLKSGLMSPLRFFVARQDYVHPGGGAAIKFRDNHLRALLLPFRNDPATETERYLKIAFFALIFALIAHFNLWKSFLLLWILPMYTVYPMILTFMDLTEHRWVERSTDPILNSRAIRYGFLARILFSFLPRGLHREHHLYLPVIAADLPRLSKLLCDGKHLSPPIMGLGAVLADVRRDAAMSISRPATQASGIRG